ncbi:MAG: tRNA (5-methylaminomethyl-2-thiouridine)(34)-methyltransferase MnmD [Oceanococcaceae bacterium]
MDWATVEWGADGCPRSTRYHDVFHSLHGAAGQWRHVFFHGNDLPRRWQGNPLFAIGELGFGSGLSFLLTASQWLTRADRRAGAGPLIYMAIEQHPWPVSDTRKLIERVVTAEREGKGPEDHLSIDAGLMEEWLQQVPMLQPGSNRLHLANGQIELLLHIGAIETILPHLHGRVDAWFLDGFNPRHNAAMWDPHLWPDLHRLSRPGATLATWCCAGAVRRGLAEAGFTVKRAPGFAQKRDMLIGATVGQWHPRALPVRARVLGAGLAGGWMARTLAERGVAVDVHDAASGPAHGASGMPMLMIRPYARHRDTPTARFFWLAATFAVARLQALDLRSWAPGPVWRSFGTEVPHWLNPAGWCDGAELCARLLDHPSISVHWKHTIAPDDTHIPVAPTIWCTATTSSALLGPAAVLQPIRGQQSFWHGAPAQLQPYSPRVGDCVAAETAQGVYFGATYAHGVTDAEIRPAEALQYGRHLPVTPTETDLPHMQHWPGVRQQSRDRLPLCGPAVDVPPRNERMIDAGRACVRDLPQRPGQWLNLAHGARGATSAPLCAAQLADQLLDLPESLSTDVSAALDPRRFLLRAWRRGQWSPSN